MQGRKTQTITIYSILLIVPALLVLLMEFSIVGKLCIQTSDARVYISIADNYINTGHFIQTARPYIGMVVPPGTPLMITMFRMLGFSNFAIMAAQVLMFGISNIFLYEAEKKITGSGGWAPVIYTMAYLRCFFRLGVVMVEHYYLFLLCMAIWLIYSDTIDYKKIVALNVTGLVMVFTRPVLLPAYLAIMLYSLSWSWKNKKHIIAAGIILLPILILGVNVSVNYRETGEIILLENYSGYDLYSASQPDSPVTVKEAAEYSKENPDIERINNDNTLTMTERNKLFKMLAKENIKNNLLVYLRNSCLRGYELFFKQYYWATIYPLLGGVLLAIIELKQRRMNTIILLITMILAIVSSFGVIELRYSIVIWPMASVHGAYLTHFLTSLDKEKTIN